MYIYDDFMWDYDGFIHRTSRLSPDQQPENPKRKYVKSGRYATKNKVAEVTQVQSHVGRDTISNKPLKTAENLPPDRDGNNSGNGVQNSNNRAQSSNSGAQNSNNRAQSSGNGVQNSNNQAQSSGNGVQNSDSGARNSGGGVQNSNNQAQNSGNGVQNSDSGARNSDSGAQNSNNRAQSSNSGAQNSNNQAQNSARVANNTAVTNNLKPNKMLNTTKNNKESVKSRFLSGKNINTLVATAAITLNFGLQTLNCFAQCPNGLVYSVLGGAISSYDPSTGLSSSTGITGAGINIAYGPNLNVASPSPTFYSTLGSGNYAYWDGVGWVDTGHLAGPCCLGNIASGGSYLYALSPPCSVWRYDGTGTGVEILSSCPAAAGRRMDLATDACGNFMILDLSALNIYSPAGTLLNSYTVTGLPGSVVSNGGLSIVGGKIYATDNSGGIAGLYEGTISGSNISFVSVLSYAGSAPVDLASCPDPTVSASCVLPIELLSFTANCSPAPSSVSGGVGVRCAWQTATETNNDYFTIERSSEPGVGSWEKVGTVKGAGNSSTTRSYEFVDQSTTSSQQPAAIFYYRLSQTDFDGKTEVFNSQQVAVDVTECAVNVFPNPSGNTLNVPYVAEQDGEIILQVYDVIGKLVKESRVLGIKGHNSFTIDLTTVAQGMYILKVSDATGKKNNQKFIKQ